jgi:hypothetical protein
MQEYVTTLVKLLSSSDISIVTPDFIESTLEISNLAISTDKLKCLGWVPKSSIEDTWRKAINLFKEL